MFSLTDSPDDVTQRYAAMGIRFLVSNAICRVSIVQDGGNLRAFVNLAQTPLIDFQRTAAVAFSSFSLAQENRAMLVREGGLAQILACLLFPDLQVQRDCAFALANVCDSVELQDAVVREGAIPVLVQIGMSDDARVQREAARAFSCLSLTDGLRKPLVDAGSLETMFALSRSMDLACQRFASLSLANLSAGDIRARLVTEGMTGPLVFLARFPDADV